MDHSKVTVKTFDKYAAQYQDKYMEHEPYIETYRVLGNLIKADARVLDVACGPGNVAKFLLDEKPGLKIQGVDLSMQMVELARKNNPSANFDVLDSRAIASLEPHFDAIVSGFCIPYLSREEVEQFVVDCRRLIRPYGILYISTMEGDYEDSAYQSNDSEDRVYIYYYQAEYLSKLLESNGFEIIDVERKPFVTDDGHSAVDLFIYARAC